MVADALVGGVGALGGVLDAGATYLRFTTRVFDDVICWAVGLLV